MARFKMELPTEILRDFEKVHRDSEKIFGGMTKAGAEIAMSNMKATVPIPQMASHTKLTNPLIPRVRAQKVPAMVSAF